MPWRKTDFTAGPIAQVIGLAQWCGTRSKGVAMGMVTSTRRALVGAALALAAATAPAAASVIYSNFGPGQTFALGAPAVGGAPPQQALGMSFAPAVDAVFDRVILPLSNSFPPGSPSAVTVSLAADAAGLPGATIESFDIAVVNDFVSLITLDSLLHPVLTALMTYWIVVEPGPGFSGGWNHVDFPTIADQLDAIRFGAGPWLPVGSFVGTAFEVQGTAAVPEPPTFLVFLAGMVLTMLLMRRGRAGSGWRRAHCRPAPRAAR